MRKSTPWGWGCRMVGLQPNGRVFPSADKLTGWQTHGRAGSTQVRTVGPPSHSFLANFGARRFPKGNEGKRVSSGYNRRRRLATRSSGKQQAERTAVRTAPIVCPEESPLARPQAQAFCRWGLTRRLRRGRWGCRPDGGSYFLSTRKKVPKKARGTATPGKRLLLPILAAGLAMSRAMELDSFHQLLERARARLFPPSKWAGLFPSAAYRRPAPAQLAGDILNPCRVGCNGAA